MNFLLTDIQWDAKRVLALSLPTKILVLDAPDERGLNFRPAMQRFLKTRFGYSADFVGYNASEYLQQISFPRINVVVTLWEDTP